MVTRVLLLSIWALVAAAALRRRTLNFGAVITASLIAYAVAKVSAPCFLTMIVGLYVTDFATKLNRARRAPPQPASSTSDACEAAAGRSSSQILANCGVAFALALTHLARPAQFARPRVERLIMYSVASAVADSVSSEIGALSPRLPRLILRPTCVVSRGVNGAVTMLGFGVALAAGLLLGATFALLCRRAGFAALAFSGLAGVTGSAIDSVIGLLFEAEPQALPLVKKYAALNNDQVNFLSAVLNVALVGALDLIFVS